jgi:hypothetical protein
MNARKIFLVLVTFSITNARRDTSVRCRGRYGTVSNDVMLILIVNEIFVVVSTHFQKWITKDKDA